MAVLLMGAAILPAIAASANNGKNKYGNMLVLGDSISTGYGLQNYTPGGDPYLCQSYGNILAASLGLENGKNYINRAVNGDASYDLLALLPSMGENIKAAELIVISIGGNDLLHILPQFASSLTGRTVTDLQAAASAVMAMDSTVLSQKLADPAGLTIVLGAISEYSKNLPLIIEGIHTVNPTARVIFLAQYNPMAGSFVSPEFGEFAGNAIDSLNLALNTAVEASGYGYEVADIPSVINVNAVGYTNISDADIHPNADGHAKIAEYLIDLIADDTKPAEVTSAINDDTTVDELPADSVVTDRIDTAPVVDDNTVKSGENVPIDTTSPSDTVESGCGSSLAMSALVAATAVGAAVAFDRSNKKKK